MATYPRTTTAAIAAAVAAAITLATSVTIGTGGTAITKHLHTTVSIDPNSIAGYQATSSRVALSGAAVGNTVVVSANGDAAGTTSTIRLSGSVVVADTVDIVFNNSSSSAVNLPVGSYNLDTWAH
jgi:hypothetical protein